MPSIVITHLVGIFLLYSVLACVHGRSSGGFGGGGFGGGGFGGRGFGGGGFGRFGGGRFGGMGRWGGQTAFGKGGGLNKWNRGMNMHRGRFDHGNRRPSMIPGRISSRIPRPGNKMVDRGQKPQPTCKNGKCYEFIAPGRGGQGSFANVAFLNYLAADDYNRPVQRFAVRGRRRKQKITTTTTTEATVDETTAEAEPSADEPYNDVAKVESEFMARCKESPVYIVRKVYDQLVRQNLLNTDPAKCIVVVSEPA